MKRIKEFLLRHEYLILTICISALLRLPSLLEPYWYGDEGIYLTLGTGVRKGLELYKHIHDNKPPLLYLMAALTGSVFWFRFLLLIWNSVALILFQKLGHSILDGAKKRKSFYVGPIEFFVPRLSEIATFLFAILPIFAEGNIANGEIFMILPTIAGMYTLWMFFKGTREKLIPLLLAGFYFSCAFLFKVPAAFDAVAAGLFFFVMLPFFAPKSVPIFQRVLSLFHSKYPYLFAFAFLAPIVATIVYYTAIGAGKEYVTGAFAQNVNYLSSWQTGTHETAKLEESGLKNRAIVLGVGTLLLFVLAPFAASEVIFLSLWFGFALFGALLSERPYPHYLIQIIPPGIFLLCYVFTIFSKVRIGMSQKKIRYTILSTIPIVVCIALFVVSLIGIKFWYYPVLPYYQNYWRYITRQSDRSTYFSYFDKRLPELYQIAELIEERTEEDRRIFVWGDLPMLYALTRRLPPGRYTSSYHIKDFNGYEETIASMDVRRPKLIIVDRKYDAPFVKLEALIIDEYIIVYTSDDFVVYQQRNSYNTDTISN